MIQSCRRRYGTQYVGSWLPPPSHAHWRLSAKKAFLRKYAVLLDETPLPKTTRSLSHDRQTDAAVRRLVLQQLFRHLVLWCPTIRPTAVRLGSISELFTSNVISIKGLNILEFAIEHDCFGNGLTWWKSAVLEAVHIVSAIPPKGNVNPFTLFCCTKLTSLQTPRWTSSEDGFILTLTSSRWTRMAGWYILCGSLLHTTS